MSALDAAAATVGAFPIFGPNPVSVRHYDPSDQTKVADVRLTECFALTWSLVVAGGIAALEKSGKPLIVWAIAAGAMLALYELALQSRRHVADKG